MDMIICIPLLVACYVAQAVDFAYQVVTTGTYLPPAVGRFVAE
jgi:hypothetical protein